MITWVKAKNSIRGLIIFWSAEVGQLKGSSILVFCVIYLCAIG